MTHQCIRHWLALSGAAVLATGLATFLPAKDADTDAPVKDTISRVATGASAFAANCASCHGVNLEGQVASPLKGAAFQSKWAGQSRKELLSFISSFMPPSAPGSLEPQVYADITAFLLAENGIADGG